MQAAYSPAGYHPEQSTGMASSLPQNANKSPGATAGSQAPQSRPQSRDRKAYRLFPSGPVHQQLSPRALQRESLERAGSLHRRRSVSLDESARNNGEPRRLLSQRSHLSLRRKQGSVPDVKTTMSTVQELPQDSPTFLTKLSYKPRVSEDGGHGRSSSAPDDFVRNATQEQQSNSHQSSGEHSVAGSEATSHGLGLTIHREQSVKTPAELRGEAQRKQHRNLRLKIEKPLPPRPGSIIQLSNQPNGFPRSNLSLPSQSTTRSAMRQDSVTQVTSFHQSSNSASNNDSYFPLSSDAKVRELMGLPPSGSELPRGRRLPPIDTKVPMMGSPSLTLSPPSSKFQKNPPPLDLSHNTERIDHATKALPQQPQESHEKAPQRSIPAQPAPKTSTRESNVSAPDMTMVPAGLRLGPAKRSASASAGRAPPPPMLEPRKWVPTSEPSTKSSVDEPCSQALATLAELTKQTESLYARHADLRSERQRFSSAIIENLKDNKPGSDYANTLLDQHMSLAAISSSMDICIAKLKSLECRKEEAIATLASSKKMSFKSSKTDSMRSTGSESSFRSATSSPALTNNVLPSPAAIISMYSSPRTNIQNAPTSTAPKQPPTTQPEQTNQQSLNEPPRRMNVKGAKAAKILGLVLEAENEQNLASPNNITLPQTTHRSKPSLDHLEADSVPPSPAPDRPLPVPPTPRGRRNAPSPPLARSLSRARSRKESGHDAYWNSRGSSRASSPDVREAQTPQEEGHGPGFSDVSKTHTDSMQTVHVYLSEPMMSSTRLSCVGEDRLSCVGEDDLLEYYRDLQ